MTSQTSAPPSYSSRYLGYAKKQRLKKLIKLSAMLKVSLREGGGVNKGRNYSLDIVIWMDLTLMISILKLDVSVTI